ncbi:hypothetical protein C8J56DRAFT_798413 [Mycena floridula]|nr:hypothetical protein C8J56DRAFT_798413 [Mycena floridula]
MILATSCDTEHGFSRSGLMVSKHHYMLSDDSIQAGTVISSWSKVPGLIEEVKCIKFFNNKHKWLNNGGRGEGSAGG